MRYGFDDLDLTRIFAETMAANVGSRATMAAVGMQYVRTFHHDLDPDLPDIDLGEVEYAAYTVPDDADLADHPHGVKQWALYPETAQHLWTVSAALLHT